MKKVSEILALDDITRNVEEWTTLDVRGHSHGIYQKRILEEKVGG
jgi:hypothetical protein